MTWVICPTLFFAIVCFRLFALAQDLFCNVLAELSVRQIQAALDTCQPFVEPIHTLVERAEQHENLALVLFERGYARLQLSDVELGALLRTSDSPEYFEHHIFGFFGH
jgi:hypothetical protein